MDQQTVASRVDGEASSTAERGAFGPGLRIARERAGVTLEAIAQSTKIKVSLLAGLENNDLSHWPCGIFRRAFFREYLAAIGIASESLVAEFIRLFPDDDNCATNPENRLDAQISMRRWPILGVSSTSVTASLETQRGQGPTPCWTHSQPVWLRPWPRCVSASTPADVAGELRLTLAQPPQVRGRTVLTSVAAALVDLCLVFLLAGVVTWLIGVDYRVGVTVVGLTYYSLATAFNRRTPGVRWLTGTRQIRRRRARIPLGDAGELERIVPQPATMPAGPDSSEALSDEGSPGLHAVSG
jgi:hypothetical protein